MEKQGGGRRWRAVEGGGGEIVAPRRHDRVGNFLPRDVTSQLRRQRGRGTCGLRRTAYGLNRVLRSVEQDRSVLQERPTPAHLSGADQLARADENFAADGLGEAGGRADGRSGGRPVRRERGVGAQE